MHSSIPMPAIRFERLKRRAGVTPVIEAIRSDTLVETLAQARGIEISLECLPGVCSNVALLLQHAASFRSTDLK